MTHVINPSTAEIKSYSDKFAESHSIKFEDVFEIDRIGVYWLEKVFSLIETAIGLKVNSFLASKEPSWAIIQSMLHRVYDHCAGSFVSFIAGTWASTEVDVRAVIEASINVMYITAEDREVRLVQYFTHFWESEKKAVQKRLVMSAKLKGETANAHRISAEENSESLDFRENIISKILMNEGFPSKKEAGWPSKIIDRFIGLGLETDYRTFYSFLSAETHNDASALVDYMIYKTIGQNFSDEAGREIYLADRIYLYFGLEYFIRAAMAYSVSFNLENFEELSLAYKSINKIIDDLSLERMNLRQSVHKIDKQQKSEVSTKRKRHK
jgi:hypothetical protein